MWMPPFSRLQACIQLPSCAPASPPLASYLITCLPSCPPAFLPSSSLPSCLPACLPANLLQALVLPSPLSLTFHRGSQPSAQQDSAQCQPPATPWQPGSYARAGTVVDVDSSRGSQEETEGWTTGRRGALCGASHAKPPCRPGNMSQADASHLENTHHHSLGPTPTPTRSVPLPRQRLHDDLGVFGQPRQPGVRGCLEGPREGTDYQQLGHRLQALRDGLRSKR